MEQKRPSKEKPQISSLGLDQTFNYEARRVKTLIRIYNGMLLPISSWKGGAITSRDKWLDYGNCAKFLCRTSATNAKHFECR